MNILITRILQNLTTLICSTAVIPSLWNQGGRSAAPTTKGSNGRDSRDAIHADFFLFSAGPYYATYLEDVDQFPTPEEMVRFESLSVDQLTAKMSVLYCMMMSHGCELLSRYRGLNQSHREHVLSVNSKLKGYEEKVASLTGLELQVSTLKKQVSRLNDKLSSSDASFKKSKAKGKESKKNIKSLTKSLDKFHTKVARLSTSLNHATVIEAEKDEEILPLRATPSEISLLKPPPLLLKLIMPFLNKIYEHATKPLSVILHIKPEKLAHLTNVPPSRDACVSPPITKESNMTPASKSLELSTNTDLTPSVVTSEHNEEMVNAEVDVSDPKMTDDTAVAKSGHAFVQGISVTLEDVVGLVEVGSRRASSEPNDVVVSLSAGEKGNGLVPSSVVGEKAAINPSRV
nr:hypothetical protein [Tanacetum cinerariifolium]